MTLLRKWKLALVVAFAATGLVLLSSTFQSVASADGNEKGGAELWANNCRQCHNYRRPSSYSSDQWEIAVTHMRYRCGLTAKEARKVIEFLKNAH